MQLLIFFPNACEATAAKQTKPPMPQLPNNQSYQRHERVDEIFHSKEFTDIFS